MRNAAIPPPPPLSLRYATTQAFDFRLIVLPMPLITVASNIRWRLRRAAITTRPAGAADAPPPPLDFASRRCYQVDALPPFTSLPMPADFFRQRATPASDVFRRASFWCADALPAAACHALLIYAPPPAAAYAAEALFDIFQAASWRH